MKFNIFINKVRNKLKKIYIYIFCHKYNYQLKDANYNWKSYLYLKRKYKKFIDNYSINNNERKTSNKVWWCWLQGEDKAPELCKKCLNSLRKNLNDREIIVITADNYLDYIDLPDYILEKDKKGYITHTHLSDRLRVQLLITHGGTWIDSSVLCTGFDENFYDKSLFVFENFLKEDKSIVSSSWFMTAESNNPILLLTRDLIFEYWKKNNKLINYFLLHICFTIATEKYKDEWDIVARFSNVPPHILQFEITKSFNEHRWNDIKKMSSIHKLTQKADFSKCEKDSYYDYIIKNY